MTLYPDGYIIKSSRGGRKKERSKTMKKKKRKQKEATAKMIALNAAVDLIVGTALILIDRLLN